MAIKTLTLPCSGQGGNLLGQQVTIPVSQLAIRGDNRIINAEIIFTAKEKTAAIDQYAVLVSYDNGTTQIIDKVNPEINGKFSVNVLEEIICAVNNPEGDIQVILDGGLVVDSSAILAIEYVSEHLMPDDAASCDVDAQKAGSGKVNLATGKMRFNRNLGAGLALTYDDGRAGESATEIVNETQTASFAHYCGKGWKLNVEQYLVETADEDGRETYTYVDGQGNYHEFYNRYYYVDNQKKNYVGVNTVNVGLNGKLTCTVDGETFDVQKELKSTAGLTLETDYGKFIGGKYLELRQNEQIELEESVEAYCNQLKEYAIVNKSDGEYGDSNLLNAYFNDGKLAAKDFESFLSETAAADKLLFTKSEAVQYNSLLLQQTGSTPVDSGKTVPNTSYSKSIDYSDGKLTNRKFSVGGYDNRLVNMQRLVKDLRADLTRLTKKTNFSATSGELNYQYDEYIQYLAEKRYVSDDKCSLNVFGVGRTNYEGDSQAYLTYNIKDYHEYKGINTDCASNLEIDYAHLQNGYCDLQAELERIGDDLDDYYRMTSIVYRFEELDVKENNESRKDIKQIYDSERSVQLRIEKNRQKVIEKRLRVFQKEFSNRVEKLQQNITKFEKEISDYMEIEQGKLIEKQISMLLERSQVNKTEIEKYFKQYLNKQHELDVLYMQLPVKYVSADDGTTMGFNKYGQFVAAFDAYENQTAIIYEDGKIVRIQNSDDKAITFAYDKDLLTKIVFADDTSVSLRYADGMLTDITDDGETTSYQYVSSRLAKASHSYGRGVRFVRDANSRITRIDETTALASVSDNNAETAAEQSKTLAALDYHESHLTTTVTDERGVAKTYVMDIMGRPATVYEGVFDDAGKTTRSLSLEYADSKKSYSVAENISMPNLLPEDEEATTLGGSSAEARRRVFDVDVAALTSDNYVFSAWAKADSAYVPSVRNSVYLNHNLDREFGVTTDVLKNRRKFELRAELTYEGEAEPEVVFAVYDWLNTGWQFAALPIRITKSNGDTLPTEFPFVLGEETKRLTGMKLIVDYSYNTGEFQYGCCSLRQGNWKKTDYREDGKPKSVQDSVSRSVTEYVYDGDRLIAEELTDCKDRTYTTKYEYNKQGSLVRATSFDGTVKETVFDEKGRAVKKITYNLSDPTSKFYEESKRDDNGVITADVDESGKYDSVKYAYDHNGEATVLTDGKGNKTAYGYKDGNLVSISGSSDGEEAVNTMNYTVGLLTKVSCGDTVYNYSYDKWGRTAKVEIAGTTYATTEVSDDGLTDTTLLASGDRFVTQTDKYGDTLVQSAEFNNGVRENVVNEYDPETRKLNRTTVDTSNAKAYNITYQYDEEGRLLSSVRSGDCALAKSSGYTIDGEAESTTYTVAEQELTYTYETDNTPEKRNSKVGLPFGVEQKFAYDGLGRTKEISLTDNLVKNVYYAKYGDHATNRVNSVWYGVNGIRKDNVKYTYDKASNITSVTENGIVTAKYVYDGLDRLVRENNTTFGKITYEYDNAGNILCKAVDGKRYKYCYSQYGWKDRLVERNWKNHDGTTIREQFEYDVLGNPVIYRNRTLSWQGRRLLSYANREYSVNYTYDVDGIRTSKHAITSAGIVISKFIYDGNNLVAEQRNNEWIYYIYGVDGIAGFNYQGNTYLYRKNVQGDVTHIYKREEDNSLTQAAHYVYDAWGNIQVLQDTDGIATLNPFRYRSYYFDEETGLYYLQSRYYDPELGRFISADSIAYLDPETLGGLNLYAYCGNNPVMGIDPDGNVWWNPATWDWKKIGKVIGGALLTMAGAAVTAFSLHFASTPIIGGLTMHLGTAMIAYGGIVVASAFDDQIQQDMEAIHWNPFNLKADEVISSQKVSFYRGLPVIRFKDDFLSSFQVGGLIFLERGNYIEDLKHESGHGIQEAILSLTKYLTKIALPSVIMNLVGRKHQNVYDYYYNFPWERSADWFGGVGNRPDHEKNSLITAIIYFIAKIFF